MTSLILFIYGFFVCGTVLSRVLIGNMPLYFVDILSLLVIFIARREMGNIFNRHKKLFIAVTLFVISLLPTTFAEYFRMGMLEPTYLLLRGLLHILAFWGLAAILRSDAALKSFMLGIAGGCLFTALVATLNSLPITGPWVRANIFTIELLFPQRGNTFDTDLMMILDSGGAERGNSLLGKSNVTGGVLLIMLPFIVGILSNMRLNPVLKTSLSIACILIFVGLLSTYSRLTYLGLLATFVAYFIYDRREFFRRITPVLSIIAIGVMYVGISSTLFKFDFLIDKFDLTKKEYQYTNMARLYSYTRPLELLIDDPTYLFRGAGRAHMKLREKQRDANILVLEDAEMHSVFAASIFWRGFLSMLLLFYIGFLLFSQTYRAMKEARYRRMPDAWLITSAFISFFGLAAPWLLEHYFISKPSGHLFLFMYFGLLVAVLDRIRNRQDAKQEPAKEGRPPGEVVQLKKGRVMGYVG